MFAPDVDASVETAAAAYAHADSAFDTWFMSKVRELSAVDPNKQPPGLEGRQVFEWNREGR